MKKKKVVKKKKKEIKKKKLNHLGDPVDDPYGLGAAFHRAFNGKK